MHKRSGIGLFFLLMATLLAAGCEKKVDAAGPGGTVKANAAYVEHFGQPPTPEKGSCFARVGFLPLSSDPAKVRAVPYFLFRKPDKLQLILDRLTSDEMVLPPGSGLFNPFPPGSTIHVRSRDGGTVTLDLLADGAADAGLNGLAVAAALTETAVQFDGIETVNILLNGSPLEGMPAGGFRHESQRIVEAGPPALVMVVGAWESGADGPEEILVDFDRPVNVQSFRLEDASGQEVKGEYFQSAFDMSVVVHPEAPGTFQEGTILRAVWEVTDRLGRIGKGAGEFALKRHDHPAPGDQR
jgi:hypothetical protein